MAAIGCMVRVGGHRSENRIKARIASQALRSVRFLTETAQEPLLRPVRRDVPPPPAGESRARRRYGHLVVVSGGK